MSITLTTDQIPPDTVAAVVAQLREVTNLLALCGDEVIGNRTVRRIAASVNPVGKPRHMLAVQKVGPGQPMTPPLARPRIQITAYASNGYEAETLAQLARAALLPLPRQTNHFTQAECVITDVQGLGEPYPIPTPAALDGWHLRGWDCYVLVNQGVRAA